MIEVTRDGALWTLRLNRPDKANALTRDMLAELESAVRAARGQANAVILTGTGKVFSAGADLDAARAGLATDPVWEDLSGAIADLPCLTIAALNGTVAGGAFGMVLACDLRIAVPEARFFYPVMKLGFLPQPSDPARLVDLVGPARAKLILMAGARIGAPEALAFGLVDEIVEAEKLLSRVRDLVADALSASPDHAAAIKRMCRR
jgi:enoyl-CoA hydratase/carnithine racemase